MTGSSAPLPARHHASRLEPVPTTPLVAATGGAALPHCARTQEATAAVAQDAQVHGISTRSVGDLVRALGMTGISTSRVSRLCEEIDERVSPLLLPRTSGPDWHAAKALR